MREKRIDFEKTLICGPCSAESKDQLFHIARTMDSLDVNYMLRAGIWKPRTKPGGFEGIGEIGIKWLCEIRRIYGIQIGWEVATEEHIDISLKYHPDFLWIGARTTTNPFMVENIAKKLSGIDTAIFVKNPSNADYSLWEGAIERLINHDVNVVGMIHRGFSSENLADYRNAPHWSIPLKLKSKYPELLLIGDPSHMGGHDFLIKEISQKMMNLNYDGLMVEVHDDPANAWTDAQQQVTPKKFFEIINKIDLPADVDYSHELTANRMQIDEIDDEILALIKRRFNITHEIGLLKKEYNLPIFQQGRYDEIIKKNAIRADRYDLSNELIDKLFNMIHEYSVEDQMKVFEED